MSLSRLEELDNEVRGKANQQKAKVLDALWQMDVQSRKKMEEAAKKSKKTEEQKIIETEDEEEGQSWHDILDGKVKTRKKKRKTKNVDEIDIVSDDVTSSMTIPDDGELDLTPDKDWSLAVKISETKAMIHKDTSDLGNNLEDKKPSKNIKDKKKPINENQIKITKPKPEAKKSPKVEPKGANNVPKKPEPKLAKGSPNKKVPVSPKVVNKTPQVTKASPKAVKKTPHVTKDSPRKVKQKVFKKTPKVAKSTVVVGIDHNDQVQGLMILPTGEDPDLQPRQESTIPDEDLIRPNKDRLEVEAIIQGINILPVKHDNLDKIKSSTSVEDPLWDFVNLSNAEGINILPIKHDDLDKIKASTSVDDPLRDLVNQCNADNNGDARDPNQKNWTSVEMKRQQWKKRYTKDTSDESDKNVNVAKSSSASWMSKDLIKDFVDRDKELEDCLNMIENSISGKIITDHRSRSTSSGSSLSSSHKRIKDIDVFTELIIDDLKRENRDLKFALVARDQRLEDAAGKVAQLVEQNTLLTLKVERATIAHNAQTDELIESQKK